MKTTILIMMLALSACSSTAYKPPPECSGEVRKINPDSVSVSEVVCEKGTV